jgi:hypothetical protein
VRFWNRPWGSSFQRICDDIKYVLEPIEKAPKSPYEQSGTTKDCEQTNRRKYSKPQYDPSKDKNKSPCQKWQNPKEIIKVLMEGFALMLAIIAGCIYFWQAKEAQRQATAAEAQIHATQKQERLDERAWVNAFHGIYENAPFITNFSDFRIEFKNTGKTPAINVTNFAVWVPGVEYITKQDNLPPVNSGAMGIAFGGMIAPDGISSAPTFNPIPNGDIETMQKKGVKNYIYGTIWYDDIFKQHHWSQFCFQVSFTDGQFLLLPMGIHTSCDDSENQNNY